MITPGEEQELKNAISQLCDNYHVDAHLLLYLDDNKIKALGSMPLSKIAPMLLKAITEKLSK